MTLTSILTYRRTNSANLCKIAAFGDEYEYTAGLNVTLDSRHILGYFGDESFQAVVCTGTTDNQKQNTAYGT